MGDILNNALKFVSKIENADWSFPSQMYPFEMEQPVEVILTENAECSSFSNTNFNAKITLPILDSKSFLSLRSREIEFK